MQPLAQTVFWLSTGLIGINFADQMLKAMVTSSTLTSTRIEAGNTQGANRASSLTFLGLPIGMLVSLILTELMYDVTLTYFTNEVEAMNVCSVAAVALLTIQLVIIGFSCFTTPWSSTVESPLTERVALGVWLK